MLVLIAELFVGDAHVGYYIARRRLDLCNNNFA